MSSEKQEPVVLELAPPPRELLGPFLILGVDKEASKEEIEAHWAQRVIWARKSQFRVPLEDVNWAREVVNDRDRRSRAEAATLNAELGEGVLRRLEKCRAAEHGESQHFGLGWRPLDVERQLADYSPSVEMPDPELIRQAIAVPDVPQELPAVQALLEELARTPVDPWALLADLERAPEPDRNSRHE